MRDPVVCADGETYERAAIEAWLASGNGASPVTGEPLQHRTLLPNISLRGVLAGCAARHGEARHGRI